ncbi:LacI family transcriptional regulator [Citreimonas salinaria]|uniref:Transcriptional regulator, LacI family n=1 Tax=Citreimonas salinaria TaxID=321339 RepID=A0A1H3JA45_9RHOB|nr:LacI family transcriptional regulator [Citreimonas salinaria]SDY36786.1 transcriptional regulator, LacI family [Citreimonas salinaria]
MAAQKLEPHTRKRKAKPTLRTIAEATGFAVTTVSRALAGDERIAQSTRDTVAEAARRLGYVPDRAARRLRTGRTQVVSLLLNTRHEFLGFTHEMLSGITEGLRGTGFAVSVVPESLDEDRVATVRSILRNRLSDGVLMTRTEVFDPRVRLLLEEGFPFVSHGRTEFSTPHPWVDYDNEAFARAAVRRLVARGRRRIGIILPEARYTFSQHLRYGFISAAAETGVAHEIFPDLSLDTPTERIAAHLRDRMSRPDAPDGYVCVGEEMALATLGALADCGQVPGRDVDVIAKRASPIFDSVRPRIETAYEDLRATGRVMAQMLLKRMDGAPPEALNHLFQPEQAFMGPTGH